MEVSGGALRKGHRDDVLWIEAARDQVQDALAQHGAFARPRSSDKRHDAFLGEGGATLLFT